MQPPSSLSLSTYEQPDNNGPIATPDDVNKAQAMNDTEQITQAEPKKTAPSDVTPVDYSTLLSTDPLAAIQTISQQVAEQVASTVALQVAEQVAAQVAQQAVDTTFTDEMSLQLSTLKDEAELRGALRVFRKEYPDAIAFEPFILKEVANIIENDDDGILAPWDELLAMAYKSFQGKFKDAIKNETIAKPMVPSDKASMPPHIEGSTQRSMPETLPSFTRKQISRMTPAEFAKHEAAIESAMKHGRIKP
jgi:hypothetical protein